MSPHLATTSFGNHERIPRGVCAQHNIGRMPTSVGTPSTAEPNSTVLRIPPPASGNEEAANDSMKVTMSRWRVLNAGAKKPVDVTPQIAKCAYELC